MNSEKVLMAIRQIWGWGEDCQIIPYGSGHINDTYLVRLPTGKWILQRINRGIFPNPLAVMENLQAVAHHLSEKTYPLQILYPVPTCDGSLCYTDVDGDFWRVFPFVMNGIAWDAVDGPDTAFRAARAFGWFQKGLADLSVEQIQPVIPGFHDGNRRWTAFENALSADIAGRKKEMRGLIDLIYQYQAIAHGLHFVYQPRDEMQMTAPPNPDRLVSIHTVADTELPLRVIHADTKINNVVFDRSTGEAACVIDLDTLMAGSVMFDFGDMIRTFVPACSEEETDLTRLHLRLDIFEALTKGYLSATAGILTAAEKACLHQGGLYITFLQVLRFATDHLSGDTYYKIRYPGHNLNRARNQAALLEALSKLEKQMADRVGDALSKFEPS